MVESGKLLLTESLAVDGGVIRYGRLGPDSGRPLFLLHGTPFSSQVWRRIAPLLAQDRPVIFHDLLGYGDSDKPDGDVSLGVQNGIFAELTRHLNVERPDVIAHDFGGATALRACVLDGLRYNALMLIDAVAVRPWGSPLVQHVREYEAAFAGMPGYMHRAILRDYLQTAAFNPLSDEAQDVFARPWRGDSGQSAFYRQIAQMDQTFTDEAEPGYRDIDCPVTIRWGEVDNWIPMSSGPELAERIPQATFTPVARCGHLMQEDRPEAIAYAAQAFFS